MKTKTLFYMALTAVMTTLAACSQDDDLQQDAAPVATPIEFEITDGGYGGAEATRAEEEGYRTKFTAGDECGLYIRGYDGYSLDDKNVKLTASYENGKLTWKADKDISRFNAENGYFLYYPYLDDQEMNNIEMTNAADDDYEFFENLINGWVVYDDQDEYTNYTQSDLMTAKGTATDDGGTLKLSFKLDHRMALAEIVAPVEVDFSNSINCTPYKAENWKYRLIVNPGKVEGGVYIKGKIGSKTFTINSTTLNGLTPGQYKMFKVGSSYYVDNDGVYHVYDDKGLRAWALSGNSTTSCKLEADITMQTNWTPISNFYGTFDGNGKTITGLVVNSADYAPIGFIKNNHGTVKNLTLKNANIKGINHVGTVVGSNYSTISDCKVENGSVEGKDYVGGIAGNNQSDGEITNCNVSCILKATTETSSNAGGIIGYAYAGSFTNCHFNGGQISGDYIGGIVGGIAITATTITFKDCTYKNCEKGVGSEENDPDGITKVE